MRRKVWPWLIGLTILGGIVGVMTLIALDGRAMHRAALEQLNEHVALCLIADGYPVLVDDPHSRMPRVSCDLGVSGSNDN